MEAISLSGDLERISTGLLKLDHLLHGGLPENALVVIAGPPGVGKTILSLHLLAQCVRLGRRSLYINTAHQPAHKVMEYYGSLPFLRDPRVRGGLDFYDIGPMLRSATDAELLNHMVRRVQDTGARALALDNCRAVADLAGGRGQAWRFLGELSSQLVTAGCLCLLVGQYALPQDLELPEFAMADVVLYLDVERQVMADVRAIRVYKFRGGPYQEGRYAFAITEEGIRFPGTSSSQEGEVPRLLESPG